ncbi:major vault protein MVP [Acrasis kona]|uniref:Major vault protein n=1 Tax=Acrasis kona TaxID=1008807 RepID=A0AAW2Z639_9EUKA
MTTTLLKPFQYLYVQNNDSGVIKTIVGPTRVEFASNEQKLGEVVQCRIVTKDEYAIIKNPYNQATKQLEMGDRKVVVGPTAIALQYGESFEVVEHVHILAKNQALRLTALQSHDDKSAGTVWQVKGPCRFIPNKYTQVQRVIDAILINQNEGIYVIDTETSTKKLIKGPRAYLLEASEELYYKQYSQSEISALNLSLVPKYQATSITIQKSHVVCILDADKNERVVVGPSSVLLSPEEHVKCLELSAGKPKIPKQIKAAIIKLGPDFMTDTFEVRTRDNAALHLVLTYKWMLDEDEPHKVFSLPDFIGYACTTLCSSIREEAAMYTFEQFHSKTVEIIRGVLFKNHEMMSNGEKKTVFGLLFDEINLLISEVDVKSVKPVNSEINKLLNQSIKSNMIIVCNKMEQDANKEAEKEKIKAESEIQKIRESLIDIENENERLRSIERAKINGLVLIEKGKRATEAQNIKYESDVAVDLEHMRSTIALLNSENGKKYLELQRVNNMSNVKQTWYLACDNKASVAL